jgi:acetyltransferase
VDRHFLTPLFSPSAIVVFAGGRNADEVAHPQARMLLKAIQQQAFAGSIDYLDTEKIGTLSELAH